MDKILSLIKGAWEFIKKFFIVIINGIINFGKHVVQWFRGLSLNRSRHIPFIMDGDKTKFKEQLKAARVENVGIFTKEATIINGVYDEITDEIINHEVIGADELDETTLKILGNESLVVLN